MSESDRETLELLDRRLRAILPEEYQETYEDIRPVPMRSAALKFDAAGRVRWDEMWGSYCDLAMAGGPPHKGRLLEPGDAAAAAAAPDRYEEVVEEICRGVRLAVDLDAEPSPSPGWVRVLCGSGVMAAWLLRAITMENVAVRLAGASIELPAAPSFRLDKEIKNVVTVVAKTSHYWLGHMSRAQHGGIARIFAALAQEAPLIVPAEPGDDGGQHASRVLGDAIAERTGLVPVTACSAGWLGVECPDVRSAVWMMRALVVSNVLARREDTVLLVPVNPGIDPGGTIVSDRVARVKRLAGLKGVV